MSKRAVRTAKPCGPGRRCYGQAFAEVCASPTGRTAPSIRGAREARGKVRLPGEHGISRPTIAQGRPSDWLHLYAAVRFFCVYFRAADRGCQPAPGLPCALLDKEGGSTKQNSGELRRENAAVYPLGRRCLVPNARDRRVLPIRLGWSAGCSGPQEEARMPDDTLLRSDGTTRRNRT